MAFTQRRILPAFYHRYSAGFRTAYYFAAFTSLKNHWVGSVRRADVGQRQRQRRR